MSDGRTEKAPSGESPVGPDVRFLLANERTLLAWLRTSIALQAGGLAVLQFATTLRARGFIGIGLLLIGTASAVFGYLSYRAADRAIRSDRIPRAGIGPAFVATVVVILGVVLAGAYLITGISN